MKQKKNQSEKNFTKKIEFVQSGKFQGERKEQNRMYQKLIEQKRRTENVLDLFLDYCEHQKNQSNQKNF